MKPLLLLHGALGSASQLEPLRISLANSDRPVYSMNFSGHSGRPFLPHGFGMACFIDDVLTFTKEHNLDHVDIFGYSMGGYVALMLALLHPENVRSVVTLGTKFDWSPESAEREVKKMNPKKIEEKVPAFARLLQQRHTPQDWRELMQKTAAMMTDLGASPLLTGSNLRAIKQPITIGLGDQDDMADRAFSEQVANWLPAGKFRLLEDTPHPIEKVELQKLLSLFGTNN
jgi:pimeloyl-ACP methyl ester carboxylesterase